MAKSQVSRSLPGVRRIFYTPCSMLPDMMMVAAICGAAQAIHRSSLVEIPFVGNPVFRREATLMGGARAQKCSLEFRSDAELPHYVYLAFVVELVNSSAFIIGTRERNYPVVVVDDNAGSPGGDPCVLSYKITHTDIMSGLSVII